MKSLIKNILYPKGSVAKIVKGPLNGFKFIVSDNSGWSPIIGKWEPELQSICSQIIRPGMVIYDLGANNGIHSLLFGKLTGEKGKVFSFEPLETNIEEIQANYRLNEVYNIQIAPYAVSNYSGEAEFQMGRHDKQGSLTGMNFKGGKKIKVQTITLDDFISKGHPAPDFLKIDIEGAESDALKGFENKIKDKYPLFSIELHTPEQDKKVGNFLLAHNYKLYRVQKENYDVKLRVKFLHEVEKPYATWPDPQGVTGTILAVHPTNAIEL